MVHPDARVELNLETFAGIEIAEPWEVLGREQISIAGIDSHDVRFLDGGRVQYAINSRGQLVDFRAKGVTVRVSPDNRVFLLTTRPDRQTGVAAWCAAHRQSVVVSGGLALAFALGWLMSSLPAISGPFAAGSLMILGLMVSAAVVARKYPSRGPVVAATCFAILWPLTWCLTREMADAMGVPPAPKNMVGQPMAAVRCRGRPARPVDDPCTPNSGPDHGLFGPARTRSAQKPHLVILGNKSHLTRTADTV
ncbi:hypothetical protein [Cupriavidus basilensis]|uniref:Uncharacterized protein n=1 Tax=Cupriavidus basilensis TaxID=68895 RepID=A0A643FZ02_9BURK|nr:hypothetical protein [Cupriavidus basilensis]QOT79241.1 hypothetical protein F7R26_031320 [Cupriavidus basilensis]